MATPAENLAQLVWRFSLAQRRIAELESLLASNHIPLPPWLTEVPGHSDCWQPATASRTSPRPGTGQ